MEKDRRKQNFLSPKRIVWGVLGVVGCMATAILTGGFGEIGRVIVQKSQIIQQEIEMIQREIENLLDSGRAPNQLPAGELKNSQNGTRNRP